MNEQQPNSSRSPFTFGPGEEWVAMAAADAYELLFPAPADDTPTAGEDAGDGAARPEPFR